MIKRLAVFLLAAYVSVASFNIASTSLIPQTTTYLITTVDGRGNGSGVLIGPHELFTAKHVADVIDMIPLFVKTNDGRLLPVKVQAKDTNSDLAILFVEGLGEGPYASIASDVPNVGSSVTATGYPMHFAIQSQITTEGKILSRVEDRLLTSVSIMPGNSGGGLFKTNWLFRTELVGITVSVPVISFGMFGLPTFNYSNSVPTDYINLFISNYGW